MYTLVGLDYNQQSTMSNDATNNHRSQQRKTLYRARKGAKDTNKTTILICGPGATVGLDMEWATHAVHWDVRFGNVETISQKSWRLDRRWNGSNDIFYRFKVTFLLNSNELTNAYRANDIHRQNRVVLGDRRYLPGGPGQPLFPSPSQFVSELWSQNGQGTHLTNYEARWIWDWIQSEAAGCPAWPRRWDSNHCNPQWVGSRLMDPTDKMVRTIRVSTCPIHSSTTSCPWLTPGRPPSSSSRWIPPSTETYRLLAHLAPICQHSESSQRDSSRLQYRDTSPASG